MKKNNDCKIIYWLIIFSLFIIPVTNGFFVSIRNLVKGLIANYEYKLLLSQLNNENKDLQDKIRYYNSTQGLKTLIKDRLNKVEEGELLIKFNEKH
ncbi:MAG: hypothetical protein HYY52_08965 [Candidatus Melainabacteria bacterium]|nr:hypothetical protein [Candidatus Melainabacteria bacterium]